MYKTELPRTIEQIIVSFYGLGLWSMENEPIGWKSIGPKVFHFTYYMSCVTSIAVKAFTSDDPGDAVFLTSLAILATVHLFRLLNIMIKKSETITLIDQLGTHSANDSEEYRRVDVKIKRFLKYGSGFIASCLCEVLMVIIFPILSNGKAIINVAFPWSSSSRIVFWTQQVFVLFGALYSVVCVCTAVIVWYLLLSCAVKYEILGTKLRNLGKTLENTSKNGTTEEAKSSKLPKRHDFNSGLIEAIQFHRQIVE